MNNSMSINSTTQIEIDKLLTILRTIKTDNEKLNSYISIKETELFIKNFPTNKTLGIDGFTGQFKQAFRKQKRKIYFQSLYEANISLIQKWSKVF